jgi:hypothetical protein
VRKRIRLVLCLAIVAVAAAACVDPATTGHNSESLTLVNSSASAPPCTNWNGSYLTVTCNTTLTGLHIKGGLYIEAPSVTVRDSIVEGGAAWFIIARANSGTLVVEDVTARWQDGGTNPSVGAGAGVIQSMGNLTVRRSNLSGNPDGIQCAGTCLVEDTWIHGLAMVGTYPNNTHNDGIQFYSGDLTVRNSMIDLAAQAPHTNAAIFLQGSGIDCVTVEGDTWLDGGGYTFYGQNGRIDLNDTRFGDEHLYGEKLIEAPAVEVADC